MDIAEGGGGPGPKGGGEGLYLRGEFSEMEPSGVSVEVTKSCTNKDHCQSETAEEEMQV